MIVAFISLIVCLGILWASGIFGDMLAWLITNAIPWIFFPVLFFSALFWTTDQLSNEANLVVSFVLAMLYCAGGVLQFAMTFYLADSLLTIRRVTRWDTYTHWSIKPRIRAFALLAIIVGGMGVLDPRPLQGVFISHKAGLSLSEIFSGTRSREPNPPGKAPANKSNRRARSGRSANSLSRESGSRVETKASDQEQLRKSATQPSDVPAEASSGPGTASVMQSPADFQPGQLAKHE